LYFISEGNMQVLFKLNLIIQGSHISRMLIVLFAGITGK